mmetsp:Transcript_7775/g.22742  ORF Transcript_7775/g.22742 Transcript_7775/m.22742 type:complete len:444 (-) Transcript_7775:293-1624(-)
MPLPCSRASISCSSAMISPEDQPLIRRTEPALLSQLGGGLARRARRLAALESVQRPEVVHIPRLWPHHQPEPAAVVWQRVHREVVAHAAVAVDVPAVPEGLHQPGHAHRHADRHPQGQVRVRLGGQLPLAARVQLGDEDHHPLAELRLDLGEGDVRRASGALRERLADHPLELGARVDAGPVAGGELAQSPRHRALAADDLEEGEDGVAEGAQQSAQLRVGKAVEWHLAHQIIDVLGLEADGEASDDHRAGRDARERGQLVVLEAVPLEREQGPDVRRCEDAAAVHCEGGGAPHVRRKVGVRLSVLCPLHEPDRPLELRRHPLLVRRGAGLLPLLEHRGGAEARCSAHVHPGAAVGRGGEWQQQQQQRHEDGARPEEEEEEGDEPARRHGAEHAESEYGRRHTGSLHGEVLRRPRGRRDEEAEQPWGAHEELELRVSHDREDL